MKKLNKFMLTVGVLMLLGGAGLNYLSARPQSVQEELTLANLEAMEPKVVAGDWGTVMRNYFPASGFLVSDCVRFVEEL